ncbi:aminotransferase class I/II-fold pyridoxal phosphate-dependent enzyme [Pelagibacteraceae bacterium]|jgi:CDP-6-deoxy-D-xylo-4-hexulose-3-dehydrase|nr:aminotransferase class I/II-fold pyridoxal phosphate-dependent enzyme [Pelagibacteraceae bacterium]
MKKIKYPLVGYPFTESDMSSGRKILTTKNIVTMSKVTRKFEKKFAKYLGVKYALMVNSGSSANLLAFFALINPKSKNRLKPKSECIIPAICWSTSLWPIVQAGLKPVFVDVNLQTFNIDIDDLKKKITKKTKAILAVHVLGNSTNMDELKKIIKKRKLTLIEDTCESLGSKYNSKKLGSFGRFGTFSFFVSHQISAGEGGMIVCNDYNDYKIIHSLRSHGWDRGLSSSKKNNFNFINSGFNLRPTDITAAIGLNQFKRVNKMIKNRMDNRKKIINSIKRSQHWKNQIDFLAPAKKVTPSWFGLPIMINEKFLNKKQNYLSYLNKQGIQTRPIISGNFLNQPVAKLYKLNKKRELFKNAEEIDKRGFFIGLHANKIDQNSVKLLTKNLLMIDKL